MRLPDSKVALVLIGTLLGAIAVSTLTNNRELLYSADPQQRALPLPAVEKFSSSSSGSALYGYEARTDFVDALRHGKTGGWESSSSPALEAGLVAMQSLKLFEHLDSDRLLQTQDRVRAEKALARFSGCLSLPEASDCSANNEWCQAQQCEYVLKSQLAPAELLVAARYVVGVSTYFEWGSGGSTETFAPLAARSYTAEHYFPWCR